jgi:serine/threonine protein kinase
MKSSENFKRKKKHTRTIKLDKTNLDILNDEKIDYGTLVNWEEFSDIYDLHKYLIDNKQSDQYWKSRKGSRNEFWNNYRLIKVLGSGSFGIVVAVEKKDQNNNRELIVLKIFTDSLSKFKTRIPSEFRKEIDFLNITNEIINDNLSPNFVHKIGENTIKFSTFEEFPKDSNWKKLLKKYQLFIFNVNSLLPVDNNDLEMNIIEMEWGGTTVSDFFNQYPSDFENIKDKRETIRSITYQLLMGTIIMQLKSIQHRDIASMNILITKNKDRNIKLSNTPRIYHFNNIKYLIPEKYQKYDAVFIDFSLSELIDDKNKSLVEIPKARLSFRAPELLFLSLNTTFDIKSDIFSLGLVIVELILSAEGIKFNTLNKRGFYAEKNDYDNFIERVITMADEFQNLCDYEPPDGPSDEAKYFICGVFEDIPDFILYIFNLTKLLGWPTNLEYPFIEETKLWKILNRYKLDSEKEKVGILWDENISILKKYIGNSGISLLKNMLKWNPEERINPYQELKNLKYFKKYEIMDIDEIKNYSNWGFGLNDNNNFITLNGKLIENTFHPTIERTKKVIGSQINNICENKNCNKNSLLYFTTKDKKISICSQNCADIIWNNINSDNSKNYINSKLTYSFENLKTSRKINPKLTYKPKNLELNKRKILTNKQKQYYRNLAKQKGLIIKFKGEPSPTSGPSVGRDISTDCIQIKCPDNFPSDTRCWRCLDSTLTSNNNNNNN